MAQQPGNNDNLRGTVPRNAPRGTPDVMGRQGGDRSASNRPGSDGQQQR